MHLLSLIGEQPIPNLLVARALQPQRHLLCYTTTTHKVSTNLADMLPNAEMRAIEPYTLPQTLEQLRALCTPQTVINLTGGTKPMALAAYEAARQLGLPFDNLQSEGKNNILYQYHWQDGQPHLEKCTTLGALITIEDYLQAHGLNTRQQLGPQNAQEYGLRKWFDQHVDECLTNLVFESFEMDFILRRGNQVAVAEAKDRKENRRDAIDLLNTIAGREYLGTYTGTILITRQPLGSQLKNLADARQIETVHISGNINKQTGRLVLSDVSKQDLRKVLDKVLGTLPNPASTSRTPTTLPENPK